jgi:hypothetical protein
LQKINLLKDQLSDEQEGRFLVPDRALLLESLRENAVGALEYLLTLPPSEKGYRMFCACSLFLGAASLPWMQKAFESEDGSKIPRSVTRELIAELEQVISDDQAVRQGFEEYLSGFPKPKTAPPSPTQATLPTADWFIRLSGLKTAEMSALRLL